MILEVDAEEFTAFLGAVADKMNVDVVTVLGKSVETLWYLQGQLRGFSESLRDDLVGEHEVFAGRSWVDLEPITEAVRRGVGR